MSQRKRSWRMICGFAVLSVLLASTPATVNAQQPVPPNLDTASEWARDGIARAFEAGLIPQALQNNYRNNATRAEFSAFAVALYEAVTGGEITERATFNDTNDVDVQKMGGLGIVTGVGGGNFDPSGTITREQAAVMLSRLVTAIDQPLPQLTPLVNDREQISSWAHSAVGQVWGAGIMSGVGDNMFAPQGTFTREQSILTMLRLFESMAPASTPEQVEPVSVSETIYTVYELERIVLDLINAERARHGAPPVAWHDEVSSISRAHSEDTLINFNHATHVGSDGLHHWNRLDKAGIERGWSSEIMFGSVSRYFLLNNAISGWMNSLGHAAALVDPQFTHAGVGVFERNDYYMVTVKFIRIEAPPVPIVVEQPAVDDARKSPIRTFGGRQYQVVNIGMNWYDAKAHAESLGGHLATITGQAEQDFIAQFVSDYGTQNAFFLGGTWDDSVEATATNFHWLTGESAAFTAWAPGQPDRWGSSGQAIAFVRQGYAGWENRWDDLVRRPGTDPDYIFSIQNLGFIVEWSTAATRDAEPEPEPEHPPEIHPTHSHDTGPEPHPEIHRPHTLYELERVVHDLINAERAIHGAPPVAWHSVISNLSRAHSRDLVLNYPAARGHTGSDGLSPFDRLDRAGINWEWSSEIIHGGPDYFILNGTIIREWMSPSGIHRNILIDPQFTDAGVGIYRRYDGHHVVAVKFIRR